MAINPDTTGKNIASLRKSKGLTQSQLGDRLGLTCQAVSKWERGESLPDIGILDDLSDVLETTIDFILTGGEKVRNYRDRITVSDMREGIACLERMGKLLGRDNMIYRYAVDGISDKMNTDVEECLNDDYKYEALVAEAVIQSIISGAYVDISDVKNSFKHEHFSGIVVGYALKYGIK